MRSSCIRHLENEPLIVIRRWQIEACDGDACAAALLSFFEYWHNIKLALREREPEETLVQWHTEQQLARGILIYKERSIRKAITLLERKGFVRVVPHPKGYKWDRTKHFIFRPETANEFLRQRSSGKGTTGFQPLGDKLGPRTAFSAGRGGNLEACRTQERSTGKPDNNSGKNTPPISGKNAATSQGKNADSISGKIAAAIPEITTETTNQRLPEREARSLPPPRRGSPVWTGDMGYKCSGT
jgi:hypothetical protein